MNYSNHAELSLPFLAIPADAPVVKEAQIEDSSQQEDDEPEPLTCCESLMSLFLFSLLFVQFGIFFYVEDEAVKDLRWPEVMGSIALFILSTYLFRRSASDMNIHNEFVALLPEIITVAVMGLVYFSQVTAAFLFLLGATMGMALCVVVVNAYRLVSSEDDDNEDECVV